VVSGLTPGHGPAGAFTTVTLTGSGFLTGLTVTFGGVAGTVLPPVLDGSVQVSTPALPPGAATVVLTNPDRQGATAPLPFTFDAPPPSLTAFNRHGSPPAGGTLVLLLGANLATADLVTFGGVAATGLSYDAVRGWLQVTAPAHAEGFVDVTVQLADGQRATLAGFHYGPPPVLLSFTPATGKRGDSVTISGSGFADVLGVTVAFGGTSATITSRAPTQLVVTVPKLNPGPYTLVVANFDDQFSASSSSFTAQ